MHWLCLKGITFVFTLCLRYSCDPTLQIRIIQQVCQGTQTQTAWSCKNEKQQCNNSHYTYSPFLSPTQSYLRSWASRDSPWASRMKFTFTKWKTDCNSIRATLQKMQPTLRLISLMKHILKVTKMWVTVAVLMSKAWEVSCSRTGKAYYMKRSLSAKILTWDFETSWPPHILELCFSE